MSREYVKAKKKFKQAVTALEKKRYSAIMKKIDRRYKKEDHEIRESKLFSKMKQKLKEQKAEKRRNQRVEQHNHINQKSFKDNFHGVADLFIGLFGT